MIIKHSGEVPAQPVTVPGAHHVTMQILLGPQDHCPHFAMRRFTVEPAGYTPRHQHNYEHEVLVLAGCGAVLGPSGEQRLEAGDVIYVPANEIHQFQNRGPEKFEFICLVPAHVHQPNRQPAALSGERQVRPQAKR